MLLILAWPVLASSESSESCGFFELGCKAMKFGGKALGKTNVKLKGAVDKVKENINPTAGPAEPEPPWHGLKPSGVCPGNYHYDPGDIPGNGLDTNGAYFTSIENIATCAGHCNANTTCCSFEYSASDQT